MDSPALPNELDVLRDVSRRLTGAGVPFMLTGSLAMSFYAVPRMTRDIDLVVQLAAADTDRFGALFETDYYVSRIAIDQAVREETLFNLIHRASVVKVDCIPRKSDEYHVHEFSRRQHTVIGDLSVWLASREDLVLSKLLWSRESRSELQLKDVRNLLSANLDQAYVSGWAERLGIAELWNEVSR